MDFHITEQAQVLQQEIREFLKKELPSGWVGYGIGEEYGTDEGWAAARQMSKKLSAKGWLTMFWPKKYGGLEAPFTEHLIYLEEMNYHRVPGIDMGIGGVSWVASCLMLFGSEEQKKEHLPRIAQAEEFWCTGYSEPGAGSDLASLQCRAVEADDEYIINGQKIWTSAAHRAHYCWLAARTNPDVPRHKGISVFLVNMKTPGVTVRRLPNMLGHSSFNEVFFDEVRVPRSNLVGEKDRGWYYVAVGLDYERASLVGVPARHKRMVDDLVQYANQTKRNGQVLSRDPIVKHKLTNIAIECEVCRLLCYKVAWMQSRGLAPDSESAMAKIMGSELGLRVARVGMELLGLYGQLRRDSEWACLGGLIQSSYLDSVGAAIAGGTPEINRNVVAIRGLGLPR